MADVENILSCSICMEIFRVPRVLPCQHTFCQDCLSSYISDVSKRKGKKKKSAVTFQCPLCRAPVSLKEEPFDASVFPINLTVVAFVDSPTFLDICSGKSKEKFSKEKLNSGPTDSAPDKRRVLHDGTEEHIFDNLFEERDFLSWHVAQWILNPIANYKGVSFRIVLAMAELFTCVIIASYVLSVINRHHLWLIYLVILIPFGKGILLSAWKTRQHNNLRIFYRYAAGYFVLHIFELAFIGTSVFIVFFIVSFQESIRTAPVRRLTVMSELGQPQCIEEKYLDFQSVLNQAIQIMNLTFSKYVTQFHILKDIWYRLLIN